MFAGTTVGAVGFGKDFGIMFTHYGSTAAEIEQKLRQTALAWTYIMLDVVHVKHKDDDFYAAALSLTSYLRFSKKGVVVVNGDMKSHLYETRMEDFTDYKMKMWGAKPDIKFDRAAQMAKFPILRETASIHSSEDAIDRGERRVIEEKSRHKATSPSLHAFDEIQQMRKEMAELKRAMAGVKVRDQPSRGQPPKRIQKRKEYVIPKDALDDYKVEFDVQVYLDDERKDIESENVAHDVDITLEDVKSVDNVEHGDDSTTVPVAALTKVTDEDALIAADEISRPWDEVSDDE
jgi:hypothetical protein